MVGSYIPAQHPGSDHSSRSPSPQSRKNPDQRPVQRRKVQVLEPSKVRGSLNNNAGRLRQITLEEVGEGLRKEMSRQIEEPQPIRQWPVRDILSQLSTLRQ
ncbi:unnamed protein product, partial [Timema podura]|nr:unnamed protein product [Timema podura]